MKLLFFFLPGHGHIHPTLPIAKELVTRGDQVIYYTTEEYREKIEETGAKVRVIDKRFDMSITNSDGAPKDLDKVSPEVLLESLSSQFHEGYRLIDQAKSENADGIIYDPMCLWARAIINKLSIPRVLFYSGIVVTPDSDIFENFSVLFDGKIPIEFLRMFMVKENLNIAPIPPELQPDSPYLDDSYKFIGPTVNQENTLPDDSVEQIKDSPNIYISLGSVINNPQFYQICIDAFANTGWEVIMVAKSIPEHIEIPSNFIVRSFVSQLDVLSASNVFISHGGVNSVLESLWFGVPLVLVPQSSDQPIVSKRVEELGLGITLDSKNLTPELLRKTVEEIRSDNHVHNRVENMKDTMRNRDADSLGATLIQQYVEKYRNSELE